MVGLAFENERRTSYCTKYKVQYLLEIVSAYRCLIRLWEFDCFGAYEWN